MYKLSKFQKILVSGSFSLLPTGHPEGEGQAVHMILYILGLPLETNASANLSK